jgi:hypothetical protein
MVVFANRLYIDAYLFVINIEYLLQRLILSGVTCFHKISVIREIEEIFLKFSKELQKISAEGFPDDLSINNAVFVCRKINTFPDPKRLWVDITLFIKLCLSVCQIIGSMGGSGRVWVWVRSNPTH